MNELERCRAAAKILNGALQLDCAAISCLLTTRVPCNELLSKHDTIEALVLPNGQYITGVMGLINGLVRTGPNPDYSVCMYVNDNGTIVKFSAFDNRKNEAVEDANI